MNVVLGANGHVGSAVAKSLLAEGKPVRVVTHDPKKSQAWEKAGAEVAVADVHDAASLRKAFRGATHIFILNPPAPPASDIDREERHSVATILEALRESPRAHLVAESTYGAKKGEKTADSSVLFEMEEGLRALGNPLTIIRGAYYLSNWDPHLESAKEEGLIRSFYPEDFTLAMVDPADIGAFAARLLGESARDPRISHAEGPARYTPAEVAAAFARALHRPVRVEVIEPSEFVPAFRRMGYSPSAAESMANMTNLALAGPEAPLDPHRGPTSLDSYIQKLVRNAETKKPPHRNAEAS